MATFRPGKPKALRRLTAAYAPGGGPQDIVWDADSLEGEWASVSGTSLVVGLDGLYIITFQLGRLTSTVNANVIPRLKLNGTVIALGDSRGAAAVLGSGVAVIEELVAGDSIVASASIGAAPNSLDPNLTRLSVVRCGPVRWT